MSTGQGQDKAKRNDLTTPEFRAAFPHVHTPDDYGDNPKYKVTALFPKTTDISALKKMASDVAKAAWGDDIPKNVRSPFTDGSNKPELQGYEGMTVVNMSSKNPPGVVDGNLQKIIDPNAIYGGCWMKACVSCYAYGTGTKLQPTKPPGVAFGLMHAQKIRDDSAKKAAARRRKRRRPRKKKGKFFKGTFLG